MSSATSASEFSLDGVRLIYNGTTYRSMLEGAYARLFHILGIPVVYEEWWDYYQPDFHVLGPSSISGDGLYLEVKPIQPFAPSQDEKEILHRAAHKAVEAWTGRLEDFPPFVIVGELSGVGYTGYLVTPVDGPTVYKLTGVYIQIEDGKVGYSTDIGSALTLGTLWGYVRMDVSYARARYLAPDKEDPTGYVEHVMRGAPPHWTPDWRFYFRYGTVPLDAVATYIGYRNSLDTLFTCDYHWTDLPIDPNELDYGSEQTMARLAAYGGSDYRSKEECHHSIRRCWGCIDGTGCYCVAEEQPEPGAVRLTNEWRSPFRAPPEHFERFDRLMGWD